MSWEGRSTETYHAIHLDLIKDSLVVFWNRSDDFRRNIDAFCPFITFNVNLNMYHIVSCEILAGTHRLHCT